MLVTAASANYAKFIAALRASCERNAYPLYVYGLGEDCEDFADERFDLTSEKEEAGFITQKSEIISKATFKPAVILQALEKFNCPIVWVDADVVILKRFDEVWEDDFDFGVTARRTKASKSTYDGYINAGVMFFRPHKATKNFIRKWIEHTPKTDTKTDQQAVTELLLKKTYFTDRNGLVEAEDYTASLFPTEKYNFYYYDEPLPEDTKILHIKAHLKHRHYHEIHTELVGHTPWDEKPQGLSTKDVVELAEWLKVASNARAVTELGEKYCRILKSWGFKELRQGFRFDGDALEIGPGPFGGLLRYLLGKGLRTGVDTLINRFHVKHILWEETSPHLEHQPLDYIDGDFNTINAGATYDLVLSTNSLDHGALGAYTLERVTKALKPGGRFYLRVHLREKHELNDAHDHSLTVKDLRAHAAGLVEERFDITQEAYKTLNAVWRKPCES